EWQACRTEARQGQVRQGRRLMNLSELNDLDLRDINFSGVGDWPWIGKAIVVLILIVIVLAIGYFLVVQKQLDTLEQAQKTEVSLKHKFESKQPLAANLDVYKHQLTVMNTEFQALLSKLPKKNQIDALLANVSQTAREDGLVQKLFRPQGEKKKEF